MFLRFFLSHIQMVFVPLDTGFRVRVLLAPRGFEIRLMALSAFDGLHTPQPKGPSTLVMQTHMRDHLQQLENAEVGE